MERLEKYLVELCRRGRDGFCRFFPEPVLLVRLAEDELTEFDAITDTSGPKKSEMQELIDLHADASEALSAVSTLRVKRMVAAAGPRFSVGRTIDNYIPLPGKSVSKVHASIELHEGGITIRDAGSKNGTKVAGVPLEEGESLELAADLASGVSLQFGDVTAIFYSPESFVDFLLQVFPWAKS